VENGCAGSGAARGEWPRHLPASARHLKAPSHLRQREVRVQRSANSNVCERVVKASRAYMSSGNRDVRPGILAAVRIAANAAHLAAGIAVAASSQPHMSAGGVADGKRLRD